MESASPALALTLGSIIGMVMALTGAGGGVLSIPLLVFGLHLNVQQAAPVGLVAVAWPPCWVLGWACAQALAGTGLIAGMLGGLLGVGGGFVIIPALKRHTDLDIRSIQATSLAVIALVSVSAITAAAMHAPVRWSVACPLPLMPCCPCWPGSKLPRD